MPSPLENLIFIPRWLNQPMYPGGFPIRAENHGWEDKSARAIYYQDTHTPEEFQFIKEYFIYYLHAPIWSMNLFADYEVKIEYEKLQIKALAVETIEDLSRLTYECLDFGLNPF